MSVKLRTYTTEANSERDDSEQKPAAKLLKKHKLFLSLNGIFMLLITVLLGVNKYAEIATGAYLVLLLLICTLPLIYIRSYRSKEVLMLMFLAFYFATFGLKDVTDLISLELTARPFPDSFFSGGELVILLGGIFFMIGYAITITLSSNRRKGILTKEWNPKTATVLGLLFWMIGYYITLDYQLGTADHYGSSKPSVNINTAGFILMLRYLHPLGTLILVYFYLTTKNKTTLLILFITMAADLVLGFIGDSKELAVRGPVLFIFSYFILRDRVPFVGMVAFAIIAGLFFNIFSAYRTAVHSSHTSRSEAAQNIGSHLEKTNQKNQSISEKVTGGLENVSERLTLKYNVELIVFRTGKDIDYLEGYSLAPIFTAFIPRFILPNKQSSGEVGLLFNRTFKLTNATNTYISIGHLGEFYWNFGWAGATLGMAMIGVIIALTSSLLRLDKNPTLPRYLLLLMTIYLLILRFEGDFSMTYTVWLRLSVLLLLINALVPKINKLQTSSTKQSAT